ncbi:putative motif in proteasome subunits, Int-6, Nip-1 and TRIP-15 [Lyophyllum shimeji]|uniref:Motif in proteasome subunits, Int-6, Nip-1 and TRIP-15 n=1 Tax=Lyophyllum shimeji TaxID=47721 RepID=A0A9P3UIS1_LYOSH|nr:putative motif in proteasome subunits, Int-6, Nip-1 and TRIP-15 [Lyophyllum shimeji]
MQPIILRDPDATNKLLEAILDAPNGKRMLSRLARTCRALCEPALNILWRDLDSLVPILWQFPGHLLKKARKPGLGFVKMPTEEDWKSVLKYSERVRQITYNENANNVAASVFSVLEEHHPRSYILPHLAELNWKAETSAGLARCFLFLNPELRAINLEIGTKFPQLETFLANMSNRTNLTSFSFISPTSLPDSFTDLLARQIALDKVVLVAPGALAPGVGRWIASLPQLKTLSLDLTGRSMIAVEGFFDELRLRSGDSTPSSPSSVGSTDSGVFSDEEVDFSLIRKSALRLTGDLRSKGSFAQMRKLHLTGEVSNIAVFIKHLTSPLTQLELVIEDPPDKADWHDLSAMICDKFGDSLQSLKVTATGSSRFVDLVRATSRAEPASGRLSLEYFSYLPYLTRLDIDLPESVIFTNQDVECVAKACPNLEVLRLCPLARFPSSTGAPRMTLNTVAYLIRSCKNLQTLAVVVDAKGGNDDILRSRQASSKSLLRLHMGHSWIDDPLPVAILMSHLTPRLETLKWFQEKNRPGFNEANARNWQRVAELLPHLQGIRLLERQFASEITQAARSETSEKSVDASIKTVDRGVHAVARMRSNSVQASTVLLSQVVQVQPSYVSIPIDARPSTVEIGVEAIKTLVSQEVHAVPSTSSKTVDAKPSNIITKSVQALLTPSTFSRTPFARSYSPFFILPTIVGLFSLAYRLFIFYPLSLPSRILRVAIAQALWRHAEPIGPSNQVPSAIPSPEPTADLNSDIPLNTIVVEDDFRPAHYKHRPKTRDRSLPFAVPAEVTVATWLDRKWKGQTGNNNTATRHSDWIRKTLNSASYRFIMSDNKKQEKDFTKEVDALLPDAESLAKSGKLQEALDKIFTLEKHTRNAADLNSTTRLVKAALELAYQAKDFALLNSTITTLSKKHGQLKAAIQAMVEQAMGWLDEIRQQYGVEKWLELVETLRQVTEGKIFLETPRARVTLMLAHYYESLSTSPTASEAAQKEALQTASDLLSDLQVETYSSMDRREKTEFILEQMRLLITLARRKDAEVRKEGKEVLGGGEAEWVKARVGGRKVSEEFLKEKSSEDLKLKYYDLMIQHALHQNGYLDVAKYYYKVWETPSIKEDTEDKGKAALEHIVYYVVLAPHDNEQSDMLHHLYVDPALSKLELHYNLVKCFVTRELMRWPGIETIYGEFLRQTPVFSSEKRWEDLHTRVIEHNIRVVAEYYTRITLTRLTSLLDLTPKQTEETLARLVVSGTIWARIDRPAGIVDFRKKRSAEDVMNDWSSDMQKLLGLAEKTWMGVNAAQAAQSRVIKPVTS